MQRNTREFVAVRFVAVSDCTTAATTTTGEVDIVLGQLLILELLEQNRIRLELDDVLNQLRKDIDGMENGELVDVLELVLKIED